MKRLCSLEKSAVLIFILACFTLEECHSRTQIQADYQQYFQKVVNRLGRSSSSKRTPDFGNTCVQAVAYATMGSFSLAAEQLRLAIETCEKQDKANLWSAYEGLANIQIIEREYSAAIDSLEKSIKSTPYVYDAAEQSKRRVASLMANMSLAYELQGNRVKSQQLLKEAKALVSENDTRSLSLPCASYVRHLARNASLLENQSLSYHYLSLAESFENKCLGHVSSEGNLAAARIYYRMGRTKDSFHSILKSIRTDRSIYGGKSEKVAWGYRYLAQVYISAGLLNEAEKALKKAVDVYSFSLGSSHSRTRYTRYVP